MGETLIARSDTLPLFHDLSFSTISNIETIVEFHASNMKALRNETCFLAFPHRHVLRTYLFNDVIVSRSSRSLCLSVNLLQNWYLIAIRSTKCARESRRFNLSGLIWKTVARWIACALHERVPKRDLFFKSVSVFGKWYHSILHNDFKSSLMANTCYFYEEICLCSIFSYGDWHFSEIP